MRFNRRWVWQPRETSGGQDHYQDALNDPNNICWSLKKWGFCQRDGNEITGIQNFRWKYDVDNKVYFDLYVHSSWNRNWNLLWDRNYYNTEALLDYALLEDSQEGTCVFFIPLKNQGFILNNYDRYSERGVYTGPTPPLNSIASLPDEGFNGSLNFFTICFFNNITNKFNYLYSNRYSNMGAWWYARCQINIADQISNQHRLSLVDDTNGVKASLGGQYTDVKQNICTMIKYPYQNGFLSNLFLITTAPRQGRIIADPSGQGNYNYYPCDSTGLDNKFFSFNGRNFYGIYANLAVELPAN